MEYVESEGRHGYEYMQGGKLHRILAPYDVPKEVVLSAAERALWFQLQEANPCYSPFSS